MINKQGTGIQMTFDAEMAMNQATPEIQRKGTGVRRAGTGIGSNGTGMKLCGWLLLVIVAMLAAPVIAQSSSLEIWLDENKSAAGMSLNGVDCDISGSGFLSGGYAQIALGHDGVLVSANTQSDCLGLLADLASVSSCDGSIAVFRGGTGQSTSSTSCASVYSYGVQTSSEPAPAWGVAEISVQADGSVDALIYMYQGRDLVLAAAVGSNATTQ
ncbi:MAG: hypothetical protein Kow0020_01400 [Wenzhouxiangellaceae bacterium]